ncbi:hypothetical protein B4U81_23635 [Vibrio campbellii]|nr:hypothetical protein B4U81_23635 [Vibrio campbellii]
MQSIGLVHERDSLAIEQSQIRKDLSISAEVCNKWLTARVAGNRDSFPERKIIMLKNEKTQSGDWVSK